MQSESVYFVHSRVYFAGENCELAESGGRGSGGCLPYLSGCCCQVPSEGTLRKKGFVESTAHSCGSPSSRSLRCLVTLHPQGEMDVFSAPFSFLCEFSHHI